MNTDGVESVGTLLKSFIVGVVSLIVLIPAAFLLVTLGLPAIAIVCVLAVPFVIVLLLFGLPLLILGIIAITVLSIVMGLLGAMVGIGFLVAKILLFIVLPIALVGWLVGRIFAPRKRVV